MTRPSPASPRASGPGPVTEERGLRPPGGTGASTAWEVAVPAGAELGERPFWDPGQGCLLWVDISAGRLHRYRPGAGDEIVLELSGARGHPGYSFGG